MCVIIIVAVAVAVVVVVSVVSVVAAVDANVVVVVAGVVVTSRFPKSVDPFTTAVLLSLSSLIFTRQKHVRAVGEMQRCKNHQEKAKKYLTKQPVKRATDQLWS